MRKETSSAPARQRGRANGEPASSQGAILACDWNGTLVSDAERAWRSTSEVLVRRSLADLTLSGFLASFRLPLSSFFAALGVSDDDLGRAEAEWNEEMENQPLPELAPDVEALLDAMDELGVNVGVVSAAATPVVRRDVASLGLADRFAFVVGSASQKRDVLRDLVASSTVPVAYLGDTEHDVEEANAARVTSIGFSGGYRTHDDLVEAGAHHVISSLIEAVPIMGQLLD